MQTQWTNFGPDVTGATLLRYALSYIQQNPEMEKAFLVQGLWSAITAYDDNPIHLDEVSCIQGIAERFLLWARDLLIREIDFKSLIAKDKELHSFFDNIDILQDETKEAFIKRKLNELKELKKSIRSRTIPWKK